MSGIAVRAVVFDAGNTLMHLDYAFIASVLAEHGFPVAPIDIRIAEYSAKAAIDRHVAPQIVASGVEGLLWPAEHRVQPSYFAIALQTLGVPSAATPPIIDALYAHNRERCLWRVVEPDTPDVLNKLRRRGLTLAVISNADGRVEGDLEACGLRAHFATVVDSHVVGVEKPDAAIFSLTLDRIQASPDASVYVGDVFSIDVLGARRAGMDAVLVDTLGRYPGPIDCPRISRLAELLDLLA